MGDSEGGRTIVRAGLEAGDRIVVDGHSRLMPGARVAIRPDTSPLAAATAGGSP